MMLLCISQLESGGRGGECIPQAPKDTTNESIPVYMKEKQHIKNCNGLRSVRWKQQLILRRDIEVRIKQRPRSAGREVASPAEDSGAPTYSDTCISMRSSGWQICTVKGKSNGQKFDCLVSFAPRREQI